MSKYISFLLLLTVHLTFGQQITGRYASLRASGNYACMLDFDQLQFSDTLQKSVQQKTSGWGSLTLQGNEVLFHYEGTEEEDSSKYTLSSEPAQTKSGQVLIHIANENQYPLKAAYIGFYTNQEEPLAVWSSDQQENNYVHVFESLASSYLTIDYIGYSRVKIPVSALLGKNSELHVTLVPQKKLNDQKKTVSFKILSISDQQLTLDNPDHHRVVLMKKP